MRVRTLTTFDTPKGEVPAGSIISIPDHLAERLRGKVEPLTDGRELPHYCAKGDCWCSVKFPGGNYPADCKRINCVHL